MIAALYIDPRGPYPELLSADACWDEVRDATRFSGPGPIIAHPPCKSWSQLRRVASDETAWIGPVAVQQVRAYGGVLEQPACSKLWKACNLPPPGARDLIGFTIEVAQCNWGHVARKRTWLYIVGASPEVEIAIRQEAAAMPRLEPTHWCSGRSKHKRVSSAKPAGIKIASAEQRRRTPIAFAKWLISIAQRCGEPAC
jgi:hypothetical protein